MQARGDPMQTGRSESEGSCSREASTNAADLVENPKDNEKAVNNDGRGVTNEDSFVCNNEDHPNINDMEDLIKEGSFVNTNEDCPDAKNNTEIDKDLINNTKRT